MIEFKNVSKIYSTGTEAVHNASFTIDKGEFAFLVGTSGSGKSTLIKLILKEEEASKGNIIINGKDITYLKPRRVPYLRRSMGVVFQDFRLLPDKTVYENIPQLDESYLYGFYLISDNNTLDIISNSFGYNNFNNYIESKGYNSKEEWIESSLNDISIIMQGRKEMTK